MTPTGNYYFVVDNGAGVHALRFHQSAFVRFQTVADADRPMSVAMNDH